MNKGKTMNDFNKRIVERIITSIEDFMNDKIDGYGLEDNMSSNVGSIEGRELFQEVRRIISDVETAIWLSDEIEIQEKMIRYIDELKSLS